MADSEIPLAEVIQELRSELQTAMKAGDGQSLRFEVQDLELEMQVMVTKGGNVKAGGEGGVKFWVLDAKASSEVTGTYESSRVQKLTLKLRPKTRSGKTADLAG